MCGSVSRDLLWLKKCFSRQFNRRLQNRFSYLCAETDKHRRLEIVGNEIFRETLGNIVEPVTLYYARCTYTRCALLMGVHRDCISLLTIASLKLWWSTSRLFRRFVQRRRQNSRANFSSLPSDLHPAWCGARAIILVEPARRPLLEGSGEGHVARRGCRGSQQKWWQRWRRQLRRQLECWWHGRCRSWAIAADPVNLGVIYFERDGQVGQAGVAQHGIIYEQQRIRVYMWVCKGLPHDTRWSGATIRYEKREIHMWREREMWRASQAIWFFIPDISCSCIYFAVSQP